MMPKGNAFNKARGGRDIASRQNTRDFAEAKKNPPQGGWESISGGDMEETVLM